jgi:hypothetical protein
MGNDVKGDLFRELMFLDRIGHKHRARLPEQFVHPVFSGAGHGLIGRNHHALDSRCIMEWL